MYACMWVIHRTYICLYIHVKEYFLLSGLDVLFPKSADSVCHGTSNTYMRQTTIQSTSIQVYH